MAKIRRKKPPKHLVCVDTNVLWDEDKSHVVSPDFESFWDDHQQKFELELIVPAVVREELLFQQTHSAVKSLKKANEAFARTSEIAGTQYSHRVSESRVHADVQLRMDNWLRKCGATIEPTPVASIDWNSLVEKAIWRKPPFTLDSKNSKTEKGFRDALILETLRELCGQPSKSNLVFISNDLLLRETAEELCLAAGRCSVYESIDDFGAYLKLTDEKLTAEFVRAIQKRATQKFFAQDDASCLYYSAGVATRIRKEFAQQFTLALQGTPPFFLPAESWEGVHKEWVVGSSARFERLEDSQNFFWKSVLTFAWSFRLRASSYPTVLAADSDPVSRLRILVFEVIWKAYVKADGRFHRLQVHSIEHISSSFEPPTPEQVQQYKLPGQEA